MARHALGYCDSDDLAAVYHAGRAHLARVRDHIASAARLHVLHYHPADVDRAQDAQARVAPGFVLVHRLAARLVHLCVVRDRFQTGAAASASGLYAPPLTMFELIDRCKATLRTVSVPRYMVDAQYASWLAACPELREVQSLHTEAMGSSENADACMRQLARSCVHLDTLHNVLVGVARPHPISHKTLQLLIQPRPGAVPLRRLTLRGLRANDVETLTGPLEYLWFSLRDVEGLRDPERAAAWCHRLSACVMPNLPRLRELHLRMGPKDEAFAMDAPRAGIDDAFRVRTLTLPDSVQCATFDDGAPFNRVVGAELRVLTIDGIDVDDLVPTLRAAPKLTHFTVDRLGRRGRMCHGELRAALEQASAGTPLAPGLELLGLRGGPKFGARTFSAMTRAWPRLTALSVHIGDSVGALHIARLLDACPNLHTCDLRSYDSADRTDGSEAPPPIDAASGAPTLEIRSLVHLRLPPVQSISHLFHRRRYPNLRTLNPGRSRVEDVQQMLAACPAVTSVRMRLAAADDARLLLSSPWPRPPPPVDELVLDCGDAAALAAIIGPVAAGLRDLEIGIGGGSADVLCAVSRMRAVLTAASNLSLFMAAVDNVDIEHADALVLLVSALPPGCAVALQCRWRALNLSRRILESVRARRSGLVSVQTISSQTRII